MALASDINGKVAVSSIISAAELGYLNGVTSDIQPQLAGKQATITGSATTVDTETLTVSRAVQTDGTGKLAASSTVTTTELGYLDGVTSAIQTQISGKQDTITGSATTVDTETLTASRVVQTDGSGKLTASPVVTTTSLGYLVGATSALQIQINGKAATSHSHSASSITPGVFGSGSYNLPGTLMFTDGGQTLTASTTNNTFLFGNSVDTSVVVLDTDKAQTSITTLGRAAIGSSNQRLTWFQPACDGLTTGITGITSDGIGTTTGICYAAFTCPIQTPGTIIYSIKPVFLMSGTSPTVSVALYSVIMTDPATRHDIVAVATHTTASGLTNITGNYYYRLDTGGDLPYTINPSEKVWAYVNTDTTSGSGPTILGVEWTYETVQY
jgi:hypothetical protein